LAEDAERKSVPALACLCATVTGKVQGVFFRDFVSRQAVALGLTGYVRNLPDGNKVELRAEGERTRLEKLLEYLRVGPPRARVDKVAASWQLYRGDYMGFEVRY
jgi:acylphosphatase